MMSPVRFIFAAFRSRPSLIALLFFQALFLNVLLPGHTRGSITLDGKHSACCCGDDASKSSGNRPATPSQRDKDNCSICQFMAGLTPAPVVSLTLAELGLLALMPVPPPAVVAAQKLVPTYFACGPPLSTARIFS